MSKAKAAYVYSTATATIDYVEYNKPANENIVPEVVRAVRIMGGANLPNKHLVTPSGVVTAVSAEDAVFLMANVQFQEHMKAGFMRIENSEFPIESVVNDMKPADGSAPLTDADYQPGGRMHIPDAITGNVPKVHSVGRPT